MSQLEAHPIGAARLQRLQQISKELVPHASRVTFISPDCDGNRDLMMTVMAASHGIDQLLAEVDRLTQQLSAATEAGVGWASVADRLPQVEGTCLVHTHGFGAGSGGQGTAYFSLADWDGAGSPAYFSPDHTAILPERITHWMPLPKPPRPACPTGCDRCEGRPQCRQETEGGGVS